eukprot:5701959-Pleurochrysis_carterae.AAC.1
MPPWLFALWYEPPPPRLATDLPKSPTASSASPHWSSDATLSSAPDGKGATTTSAPMPMRRHRQLLLHDLWSSARLAELRLSSWLSPGAPTNICCSNCDAARVLQRRVFSLPANLLESVMPLCH